MNPISSFSRVAGWLRFELGGFFGRLVLPLFSRLYIRRGTIVGAVSLACLFDLLISLDAQRLQQISFD